MSEVDREYLSSLYGTKVLEDLSIVDWQCNIVKSAIDVAAIDANNKARSSDEVFELTVMCTIQCRVRDERAIPDLHKLDPNIPKYGCGEDWHYEHHMPEETCPTCKQSIHSPIEKERKDQLRQNFNKVRFRKLELVSSS